MMSRRSWRNQNRAWKLQADDLQKLADAEKPPVAPATILTDEQIDAIPFLSKRTRAMLKRDAAKKRRANAIKKQ
jgi:hypothetical protein